MKALGVTIRWPGFAAGCGAFFLVGRRIRRDRVRHARSLAGARNEASEFDASLLTEKAAKKTNHIFESCGGPKRDPPNAGLLGPERDEGREEMARDRSMANGQEDGPASTSLIAREQMTGGQMTWRLPRARAID